MRKNTDMPNKVLALKIDVDTERGTRIGVDKLLNLFDRLKIKATFLFSLGPDNTGRAIKRIFRPGFLKKVGRTNIISIYGLRTLMNGILLPGPHVGNRHGVTLRDTFNRGHEVGIHSYDHTHWQDNLFTLTGPQVLSEFNKARQTFKNIFGFDAKAAGTAGWQANENSLFAYDEAKLLYGSDCRGQHPFLPRINGKIYRTPQIPSTLPTLDEMIGLPNYPKKEWTSFLLSELSSERPNIFTMHAEIEGMKYLTWFESFLGDALDAGVVFERMEDIAKTLDKNTLPVCDFVQGRIPHRSGALALQQV